jgi:serine/threonine protein kinase
VYSCLLGYTPAAIKIIKNSTELNVAELKREALTMQLVSHTGIIHYYGYGVQPVPELHFIVMELAQCSLYDVLYRSQFSQALGVLTLPLRVALLAELSETIEYLHWKGIIHRDIKSHNILVSADGRRLKITDFGLAKSKARISATLTLDGAVPKGTIPYMAPEIHNSTPQYSHASDMFAFAVLVNEFLTGMAPFSDSEMSAVSLIYHICHVGSRPVLFTAPNEPHMGRSGLTVELQRLIVRGWSAVASERLLFESMTLNLSQILSALGGDPRPRPANTTQTEQLSSPPQHQSAPASSGLSNQVPTSSSTPPPYHMVRN